MQKEKAPDTFPPMRRKNQQLSHSETESILENGNYGVLAVIDDDGRPYAVPLNYLYSDGRIIIHCGPNGHKMDALQNDSRVSFCVVGESCVIPEKFTDAYRSAIAFGRAHVVDDEDEKLQLCTALALKYCSEFADEIPAEIERFASLLNIIVIDVEHLTGKKGSAAQ